MKLSFLALVVSLLATVTFSLAKESGQGIYSRDDIRGQKWARVPKPYHYQGDSGVDTRTLPKWAPELASRGSAPEGMEAKERYEILKKAAGGQALTAGKRYAFIEKAKLPKLHWRLVVGKVMNDPLSDPPFAFLATKYWEVTKNGKISGHCKISSSKWTPSMNIGFNNEFKGQVKDGVDIDQASAEVIEEAKKYNLAASIGGSGNNCQTYADRLMEKIKAWA